MTLGSRESIWDRIPVAAKALFAIAFPLIALLVVAATPNRIVESDEQSKLAAIRHVEAVDGEERALNRGLLEAETATYAYVMSGADESLEPFRRAQEAAPASLAKLESLITDKAELDGLHRAASLSDQAFNTLSDLRQYSAIPGVSASEVPADLARKSRTAVQSALDEIAVLQQAERAGLGRAIRAQRPAEASGVGIGSGAVILGSLGGLMAIALLIWELRRREQRLREGCLAEVDRMQKEQAMTQAKAWGDATQARAAEQSHRRQASLYRSALDGLNAGVVIADERGRYVYYNPGAEKILGRGFAFHEPSQWPACYALRKADGVAAYSAGEVPLIRALNGETVEREDMRLLSRDAPQPVWARVQACPLRDTSGVLCGAMLVLRDVTGEKKAPARVTAAPLPAALPPAPPPPEQTLIREAIEDAVARTESEADDRRVRLRAAIGAAWQTPVLANRNRVSDALEFFLSAVIQQCPEGGAITLSCSASEKGWVRLEMKSTEATPLDLQASGLLPGHDFVKKSGGRTALPPAGEPGAVIWTEWPVAPKQPAEAAESLDSLQAAVAPAPRPVNVEVPGAASGSTMEVVRSS